MFSGEQNFAGNESNLIYFIYPLLNYECARKDDPKLEMNRKKSLEEGKRGLINVILSAMPELQGKVDRDELKELEETSILESGIDYYMGRYPVYENDPKLKMVLARTKSYVRG